MAVPTIVLLSPTLFLLLYPPPSSSTPPTLSILLPLSPDTTQIRLELKVGRNNSKSKGILDEVRKLRATVLVLGSSARGMFSVWVKHQCAAWQFAASYPLQTHSRSRTWKHAVPPRLANGRLSTERGTTAISSTPFVSSEACLLCVYLSWSAHQGNAQGVCHGISWSVACSSDVFSWSSRSRDLHSVRLAYGVLVEACVVALLFLDLQPSPLFFNLLRPPSISRRKFSSLVTYCIKRRPSAIELCVVQKGKLAFSSSTSDLSNVSISRSSSSSSKRSEMSSIMGGGSLADNMSYTGSREYTNGLR